MKTKKVIHLYEFFTEDYSTLIPGIDRLAAINEFIRRSLAQDSHCPKIISIKKIKPKKNAA